MVAPVRILVVDDEALIARLLTTVLQGDGHEAEFRMDGLSALEALKKKSYDLLVTDLRMPGMDGLHLIEEAKKIDPQLDAVVVTAYSSAETAVNALRRGVADYVSKPFSVEEIRGVIRKTIRERSERHRRAEEVEDLSAKFESTSEDLGRHVGDLQFLHELTRMAADRATPLRHCLGVVAKHFEATTTLLLEDGNVVERFGAPEIAALTELAQRAESGRQPISAGDDGMTLIAAPVGRGAVAACREGRFRAGQLQLLATAGRDLTLAVENDRLRTEQRSAYVGIVSTLIEVIEAKDRFNPGHSRRVAELASEFAKSLGLPEREREILETAAKLHDIGKIGIPEKILNKPGKLSRSEFEVVKAHPVLGEQILRPLDFLGEARRIVRHHHERWDGGGYPDGLKAGAIPRPAALLAIVDSYDAMTSDRPYRDGLSEEKAREILREGAGVQWDPELVERFDQL
ncbi:MAG: HD domain-containing phosphohydrolase [Planctomycetota bacterium]